MRIEYVLWKKVRDLSWGWCLADNKPCHVGESQYRIVTEFAVLFSRSDQAIKMVMQWLNIMEGTPNASNVSTDDASSTVMGFTGTLADRITASIDKITTEYLGAAKPHFVAVGVTMAALAGSYALWEVGKGVVSYWLAGPLRLGANIKKYGSWAGTELSFAEGAVFSTGFLVVVTEPTRELEECTALR